MIETTLNYDGIAWPAVQSAGKTDMIYMMGSMPTNVIMFKTSGRGRPMQCDITRAFWRNFAKLDIRDEIRVLKFVARRGDPFGWLKPDHTSSTGGWEDLIGYLKPLADLWGDEDDRGESHITKSDADVTEAFRHALDWKPLFSEWVKQQWYVDHDDGNLKNRLHASTLCGYMLTVAMMQAQERAKMSRCGHCDEWFIPQRMARFCSPSCRALSSTANLRSRANG